MIRLPRSTYWSVMGMIALVLTAGWLLFGILGSDNDTFLAVMTVATVLASGLSALTLRIESGT